MNDMSHGNTIPALMSRNLPETAIACVSIPEGFPMPDMCLGKSFPTATYAYHNADGSLAYLVGRFEIGNRISLCAFSVWDVDGQKLWVSRGLPFDAFPNKAPIYRLTDINDALRKPVLITEREKCAEAAAHFKDVVSTTWRGGSDTLAITDFSPLVGRDVIVALDDVDLGAEVDTKLIDILTSLGVARLRVLNANALADMFGGEASKGFDIASAIDAGLDQARFTALLEQEKMVTEVAVQAAADGVTDEDFGDAHDEDIVYRELREQFSFEPQLPEKFHLSVGGIVKRDVDRRGQEIDVYAGSPVVVLGLTKQVISRGGWGYHIAVRTPQKRWERFTVSGRLLAGDGRELRELIADAGGVLPQQIDGRRALAEYIADAAKGCDILNVTDHPGWCGNAFALPDVIVAPENDEVQLILDMGDRPTHLATAGILGEWQDLTRLAAPNSRAAFAICAALAAPLLRPLGIEGGGFHFYGQSSRGKTTLLMLAGSVWGGGRDGFLRSWRMTVNGAEGVVADHNDLLLCLDEMTVADSDGFTDMLYMLANGHGKARAKKDGSAAASAQWNALVLSSGENTIEQQLEQGRGKRRLTGGMIVRMIDVPIEVEPGVSFEDLGSHENGGVYADQIKALSREHYGHAGRAFLQAIVNDREAMLVKARDHIDAFMAQMLDDDDDPQIQRVARRFAAVAAAGHLAEQACILKISPKQIDDAVAACFGAWKAARGGGQSEEWRSAARHLQHFFEAHGPTRFERLENGKAADDDAERSDGFAVRDRCGYRIEQEDGAWIYYVLPSAWERDVCGPHAPDLMIKIAKERGALICGEGGRSKKNMRLPDYPKTTRVFAIRPDFLADD
ncbi:DUF927 domain-containing protein [Thalassospira alkalitolerans]|uniref:DUF927 domain-containing protein n=1 Tax=Thalassospira alkalitolerans TaxID=1293890 RepID=UPI003AA8C54B